MTSSPTWSVLIPTYRCNTYLPQCLESVLAQDFGAERMQIVVVNDDPSDLLCEDTVRKIGGERVAFHTNERNLGAGGNFNRCLALATRDLVLVLHADCYLLPGFFERISTLAMMNPAAGMLACRAIGVAENGAYLWDSLRYPAFETLTRDDSPIWEQLHLMPSAVVVRRQVYERIGGYREDIANGQDWEMWSRVIRSSGIIMIPDILAAYRQHSESITGRTKRNAQNIRELALLYRHFASIHHNYPLRRMLSGLAGMALGQARQFRAIGDHEAAAANRRAWAEITPLHVRIWSNIKDAAKVILRRQ